jgi:hypothetical protein
MEDYTRRNLSYEADALKAVSGVFSRLIDGSEPIFNLSGLPYKLRSKYGTTYDIERKQEEALGIALSWCHRPGSEPKRRYMFPSWTWAGWTGAVYWIGHGDKVISTHQMSYLRSIRMLNDIDKDIQHRPGATQLQEALNLITVLVFEAPLIPPGLFQPRYLQKCDLDDELEAIIVADRKLDKLHIFPHTLFDSLVANVRSGVWSCFFLTEQTIRYNTEKFVLVVEWLDGDTAVRVGGFVLGESLKRNGEEFGLFESMLESRKVRLV